MSHNAEVKLCILDQFAETLNGIASYIILGLSFMFRHVKINCICLVLFLHELKQGLVLVKQFGFVNRNVSQADTIHMVQRFPIQLLATEEFSQNVEV